MHNNPYIQTPQWLVKFGFDLTCQPLPAGEPSSSNAATNQRPDNGDFLWPTIQIPKVFPNMQISGDPNLISQNLEVFSYDPKSNIYIYLRDCTSSIFKYQYHMPKLEVPDKIRWWRWSWRVAAGDLLQASVEPGTSVYKLVAQLVDKRVGFQWGLNQ